MFKKKMLTISPDMNNLVLLIEDDPALLKLGRIALERAGYDFIGAASGGEGLQLAREKRPCLILLDYMLPGSNGKEVFAEIINSDDERLRHTPVIMLTARAGDEAEQHSLLEMGLAAYLCKPFGYQELLGVIGNVLMMSRLKQRNRLLEAAAHRSLVATVKALVTLLAVKDHGTCEHSNRTAELAEKIAQRFALSEAEIVDVKLGALLHDIGKIGVPEYILTKPGILTPEETVLMRRHVQYGEQALDDVPHMETVRSIVGYHHEWWDGNGYPYGLRRDEIPLGARIVAVADAYDAMTSDRPYRRHFSSAVARERLLAAAGSQFDTRVIGKLFEYLDELEAQHRAPETFLKRERLTA